MFEGYLDKISVIIMIRNMENGTKNNNYIYSVIAQRQHYFACTFCAHESSVTLNSNNFSYREDIDEFGFTNQYVTVMKLTDMIFKNKKAFKYNYK